MTFPLACPRVTVATRLMAQDITICRASTRPEDLRSPRHCRANRMKTGVCQHCRLMRMYRHVDLRHTPILAGPLPPLRLAFRSSLLLKRLTDELIGYVVLINVCDIAHGFLAHSF